MTSLLHARARAMDKGFGCWHLITMTSADSKKATSRPESGSLIRNDVADPTLANRGCGEVRGSRTCSMSLDDYVHV